MSVFIKYLLPLLLLLSLNTAYAVNEDKWDAFIEQASQQTGVSFALIKAIIKQESAFRDDIGSGETVSSAGALGAMQVMPATGAEMGYSVDQLKNIEENIMAGATYIKKLQGMSHIGNDILLIAAGYNAGPGAVKKYNGVPAYAETIPYVRNVAQNYASYSGSPLVDLSSLPTKTVPGGKSSLPSSSTPASMSKSIAEGLKVFETQVGVSAPSLKKSMYSLLVFFLLFFMGLQILFFFSEAVNQSDKRLFFNAGSNTFRTLLLCGVLFSFITF